ncbi:hypothetical protein ASC94_10025 [Massilia sp. Root418]|uniref:hypothetical protein n=1 Tax=Massilia sp. Root418 TaxID=1736532 RepID=UPI0006F20273|nr:hypothetical protein [Massilia sp. Root418]KQW97121.1 hypothetical protein ASC94_10025 [Massilia sp. Root418]
MNAQVHLNMVFASGHADAMPVDSTDRRFFVIDPLATTNAQQFAERMRAHHAHIEAHQRASGVRARLCTQGCYTLYSQQGQFIGRTVSAGAAGHTAATLRLMAARMAHSEELANMCRLVDLDYERSGAVSSESMALLRKLLTTIGTP